MGTSLLGGASSVDPEPISKAALQIGSIIGSIFGANHAKAVAAEAGDLNKAVPQYQANLVAIVGAFNSGQIDAATAIQACGEAVKEYYSAVSSLIKDSSNSGSNCTPQDATGKGSNCNGPCTVGCAWVVPWANKVKQAINQGGGTVTFDSIPSHAGFNGLGAWSIQVQHPAQSVITDHSALNVGGPGVSSFIGGGITPIGVQSPKVQYSNNNQTLLIGAGFVAAFFLIFASRK